MTRIGNTNRLTIIREIEFGQILDGGHRVGDILLPKRYVDPNKLPGDEIDAFVYTDSEDRVVATTETPHAEAGDFAALKVKDVNRIGAFLDWGLSKDLLLPHSEQKANPRRGDTVVVRVEYDDKTERLYATQKLRPNPHADLAPYPSNQKVTALIASETDLGWSAIVNGEYIGLFYHNEVFEPLRVGETRDAFVKEVRPEDGLIDLSLQIQGYGRITNTRDRILEDLKQNEGFLPFHDKSPPEAIKAKFHCSKKAFKAALGALYKKGTITIESDGIRLVKSGDWKPS